MDYRFYHDESGQYLDEYTIIIEYDEEDYDWGKNDSMFDVFGASEWPFHPCGFGQGGSGYVSDEFLEEQKQIFWDDLSEQLQIYALVCGYWGDAEPIHYQQAKELITEGRIKVGEVDYGDWNREEIRFDEE